MKRIKYLLTLLYVIIFLSSSIVDFAQERIVYSDRQELSTKDIIKKKEALVLIKAYNTFNHFFGYGSGFIVSSDGKVVTNLHVIEYATSLKIEDDNDNEFNISGVWEYNKKRILLFYKLTTQITYLL